MTDPVYEFLGFNEDPYASVPTSVGFVADIPKRDAVVAAFKVSVLCPVNGARLVI